MWIFVLHVKNKSFTAENKRVKQIILARISHHKQNNHTKVKPGDETGEGLYGGGGENGGEFGQGFEVATPHN